MTTAQTSILSELQRIQGHHDQLDSLVKRAETRRNRVKTRLAFARSAIREAIDATASRLGLHRTMLALCDGQHVAIMADDGEVIVYRVSMIGPVVSSSPTTNLDPADAAGLAAYDCGCSPAEAGVPACCNGNGDCQDFEFSPDDVIGLEPLAAPIVGHPMGNGHARPAVADAVADLTDDDGYVPASAVGAMRAAAASQTWGGMSNAIG